MFTCMQKERLRLRQTSRMLFGQNVFPLIYDSVLEGNLVLLLQVFRL